MSTCILGLSAYYHDSAAALVIDGKIVAAAQEERFTRKKHDPSFPAGAVAYCLAEANVTLEDIDYVVFYDKPLIKFERLLETYLGYAPKGFRSLLASMPIWLKEKLFLKTTLKREPAKLAVKEKALPPLLFSAYHKSHAASAFFPSPYEKAAVLCLDGVGEWATSSVWLGEGKSLEPKWELNFATGLTMTNRKFDELFGGPPRA
jgi:carbamoyltransferase